MAPVPPSRAADVATPVDIRLIDPPPAGLPACARCAYWEGGTPAICFSCANADVVPAVAAACAVCGQQTGSDGACPNAVCSLEDRWFSRLYTVSEQPEQMWQAIWHFKYDEDKRWADVLARTLVGFLDAHRDELAGYDLITPCALYVGPEAIRLWDHLRLILDAAQELGPEWPFACDVMTKVRPTGRFLGISPEERKRIGEGELRDALRVLAPDRVQGRRVIVFDDVYSEGYSMREMARALRLAGAAEVAGLVLARRKGG